MAHVVCVHGLGGSASTMEPLADALRAVGHDAVAIDLPGHGTTPDDLIATGWRDWVDGIPAAEVLIGQSMGAALVLTAATERAEVTAVVAINPMAADPDALEGLEWRRSRGHHWVDAPAAAPGERAYDRLPVSALIELVEGVLHTDLSRVHQPVLVVTSDDDDVVDPGCSDVVAAALPGKVARQHLPTGSHIASRGPAFDDLVAAVLAFISTV